MKYIITIWLMIILCLSLSAQNVKDCKKNEIVEFGQISDDEFINPIFPGDFPDPSIFVEGDDYYMTHTSHSNYPGLIIWHSKDLVNWEPIATALNDYIGEIWAPELIKYEGKYYIYFPARDTRTNMVVTADKITGPWSKPIDLKMLYIDPGHIVGEDGNRYLFFSDGQLIQLDQSGTNTVGKEEKVYDGWEYPKDWRVECFCLESPKLFKKDGYFYLISAQGGTAGPATSHMAVAARPKSIHEP